jgi:hypothetical protein
MRYVLMCIVLLYNRYAKIQKTKVAEKNCCIILFIYNNMFTSYNL